MLFERNNSLSTDVQVSSSQQDSKLLLVVHIIELQLTTSRQTKYEPLQQKVSYPERAVVGLKQLANKDFNPTFGEIDVVGVVVCNDNPQTVFLADADHSLLAVTFWGSAKRERAREEGVGELNTNTTSKEGTGNSWIDSRAVKTKAPKQPIKEEGGAVVFYVSDVLHETHQPVEHERRDRMSEEQSNSPKDYWPHGKPRQSQGSVERANQDRENMLITWVQDEQTSLWSQGIRFVQLMKNRAYHTEYLDDYITSSIHSQAKNHVESRVQELGYEDMLVPHSVVSASNLQWKHGNNLLPCVYATEMSTFSSHPRQAHLKQALHTLRGEISVDLREFVSSCRDKLKSIVQQTNKVTTPVPYKASNSTSPLHQTRTSKLVTPLHRPLNNNAEELKPPSAAERKLTKLELYGDPPPLSPLVLPRLRGTLRKEFKAPQRISHSPVHSETSPPLSLDSLSD
uniref:BRCA2 OB3 domain-containing protein n=1 Tax=Timema cristinae TaxID=61476 RepID=A0A7R9D8M1_TIMCR|nr:unnamed protein product [Timema cristinae]